MLLATPFQLDAAADAIPVPMTVSGTITLSEAGLEPKLYDAFYCHRGCDGIQQTSGLAFGWRALANPYKGLRAFEEADAGHFFGREELIGQLIERLGETRFLVFPFTKTVTSWYAMSPPRPGRREPRRGELGGGLVAVLGREQRVPADVGDQEGSDHPAGRRLGRAHGRTVGGDVPLGKSAAPSDARVAEERAGSDSRGHSSDR